VERLLGLQVTLVQLVERSRQMEIIKFTPSLVVEHLRLVLLVQEMLKVPLFNISLLVVEVAVGTTMVVAVVPVDLKREQGSALRPKHIQ
jgi:hypothetical protein